MHEVNAIRTEVSGLAAATSSVPAGHVVEADPVRPESEREPEPQPVRASRAASVQKNFSRESAASSVLFGQRQPGDLLVLFLCLCSRKPNPI